MSAADAIAEDVTIAVDAMSYFNGLIETRPWEPYVPPHELLGRDDCAGKDLWFESTGIADVDDNSEIAQTEVFGPVLSVIRYAGTDDEDRALKVANPSKAGQPNQELKGQRG